jgi:hypothetical protein
MAGLLRTDGKVAAGEPLDGAFFARHGGGTAGRQPRAYGAGTGDRGPDRSMIFVGTHHKTGSLLFKNVFRDVSRAFGLTFYDGSQEQLDPRTDVWFMEHSRIDAAALADVKGVHVVRHPLSVIYSGYKYHMVCREKWCVDPSVATVADGIFYGFDGLSYQEKLKGISEPDGLRFEMEGRSYHAIMDMYRWDYGDNRFMTVKYEDIVTRFDDVFGGVFEFLGLPVRSSLRLAARHDINRLSPRRIRGSRHITDKSRAFDYRSRFSPDLLEAFAAIYPSDVLERLGYVNGAP